MPAVAGQRSRLGALVDPLGIFRGSALVTNDARDKAALEAARRLAALAPELLGAVADEGGGASGVTPPDQQLLATALLRKAWQSMTRGFPLSSSYTPHTVNPDGSFSSLLV